ncbi:hypothetical protein AB0G74_33620 [Streptomyces sp. NPDC020875]|uniref:hypothetical protein n=1 Tax=Streptomyces sp. NPDC020875 TaxID=3154898 RepID=UPI0033FB05D7
MEITSRCQLIRPSHCYAQAGPTAGNGMMTTATWLRTIAEAAALGTTALQSPWPTPLPPTRARRRGWLRVAG